ncbi:helix-turn-helix domain-containing protein [Kitasatospora aburaviensis]
MTVLDDLTAADAEPGRKEQKDRRRTELARFLKACRARVTPEDVGLPPGLRRRTPGLRREEVAQLAGVGVTWYTWLEQGRPINASEQVLAAVARALRLDGTEREHLFRLAGLSPTSWRSRSRRCWTRPPRSSWTRWRRCPLRSPTPGSTC